MVWDSHLFQNFPQFVVIHTVKSFGIANKAEIDVFLDDYTVEVTSRFKGLDLIERECQKNYRWRLITLYRRQ